MPRSLSREPGCATVCSVWKQWPVFQSHMWMLPLSPPEAITPSSFTDSELTMQLCPCGTRAVVAACEAHSSSGPRGGRSNGSQQPARERERRAAHGDVVQELAIRAEPLLEVVGRGGHEGVLARVELRRGGRAAGAGGEVCIKLSRPSENMSCVAKERTATRP
eukprot:7344928-Prymnesium_polylepis.1